MSKHLWKPVPVSVVEAAWAARERGLSLRAIAADLAARDILSPSDRPYLPGSIANMLRYRDHVDAGHDQPPAAVDDLDAADDVEIEMDEPDCQSLPPADDVDAAPIDVPAVDSTSVKLPDVMQQPLTEPEPQPVASVKSRTAICGHGHYPHEWCSVCDVDAAPVKPCKPLHTGPIDFRSLLLQLSRVSEDLQTTALASVKLRLDQMGDLGGMPAARETVAAWLTQHEP